MLTKKFFIGLSVFIVALTAMTAAVLIVPGTTASCAVLFCEERASGKGDIDMPDGTKRKFSFSARSNSDGTADGVAEINNPAFDFNGYIDIRCLEVDGNRARAAGVVIGSNDPNLLNNTAVFEVYNNRGAGGRNDTISLVYFSPPNAPPPTPQYCQTFEDFPQMETDKGNIKVKDCD